MEISYVKVRDINVYPFYSKDAFLSYMQNKKKILIAINAEKILNKDPKLIEIINRNIGYTDGMGAVWAVKQKGFNTIKIPGVELWLDIIKKYHKDKTFYLIGSTNEIIKTTVNKLRTEYPDILLKGYRNGFINGEEEKHMLIKEIQAIQPDFVFVAMGSPKQEILMEELSLHHNAIYIGLGGSFDVYCGYIKRAPGWLINLGLEWLWRLLRQPKRIMRQSVLIKYLVLLWLKRI